MYWLKASEHKPPKYSDVLVTNGKFFEVGQWYGEDSGGWGTPSAMDVTHWTWLPYFAEEKNAEPS